MTICPAGGLDAEGVPYIGLWKGSCRLSRQQGTHAKQGMNMARKTTAMAPAHKLMLMCVKCCEAYRQKLQIPLLHYCSSLQLKLRFICLQTRLTFYSQGVALATAHFRFIALVPKQLVTRPAVSKTVCQASEISTLYGPQGKPPAGRDSRAVTTNGEAEIRKAGYMWHVAQCRLSMSFCTLPAHF